MDKIKEGDKIPEFKLLNQDSKIVDIRDYIGKSLVIFRRMIRLDVPGRLALLEIIMIFLIVLVQ